MNNIDKFMKSIDDMVITNESLNIKNSYSELSTFMENPDEYLNVTYRELQFQSKDHSSILYTEVLKTDGILYASTIKACNELRRVNAYQNALMLYSKMIDIMTKLEQDCSKDDKENLEWSVSELKTEVLNTMKEREEYTSSRKAILEKYSSLLKE